MNNQTCNCPCGTTPVTNTCGGTGTSFVLILVLFILLVIIGSIYLY